MDDRTNRDDPESEPGLTLRNSQTVQSEEYLAEDADEIARLTMTRDRVVIPSSYGARGGMTPETDEGGDGSEGYD